MTKLDAFLASVFLLLVTTIGSGIAYDFGYAGLSFALALIAIVILAGLLMAYLNNDLKGVFS